MFSLAYLTLMGLTTKTERKWDKVSSTTTNQIGAHNEMSGNTSITFFFFFVKTRTYNPREDCFMKTCHLEIICSVDNVTVAL